MCRAVRALLQMRVGHRISVLRMPAARPSLVMYAPVTWGRARSSTRLVREVSILRTGRCKFKLILTHGTRKFAICCPRYRQVGANPHRMYPGVIGGVFLDEGFPECGTNNENAELYRLISETTKRKYPGALTVINPGSPMPQCFEHRCVLSGLLFTCRN